MKYLAFVLDQQSKMDLLTLFPFIYENERCHHVTVSFGDSDDDLFERKINDLTQGGSIPEPEFLVTGHFVDPVKGIECFQVNMTTSIEDEYMLGVVDKYNDRRDDNVLYHLTHSISVGRQSVESKDVVGNELYRTRRIKLFLSGELKVLDYN